MLKMAERPTRLELEQKAVSTLEEEYEQKSQGLNFVTMVEVWFFDDFFKKHKGKKGHLHL